MAETKKPPRWRLRRGSNAALCLLDLLEHLEDALRGTDEHALERLGQAAALERVASGALDVGHVGISGNALNRRLFYTNGRDPPEAAFGRLPPKGAARSGRPFARA